MIVLGVVAAGLLAMFSPVIAALDRALAAPRFGAVRHVASGNVVVVEMDAKSAAAIKRWPWSRGRYAVVVDRLREAGAAAIVFDVDFSSPSDRPGDAAFADALARAQGRVALPTFGQTASAADRRVIDSLPIPLFRPHVALASVSIQPGVDGQVRSMPFGTLTAGVPRPSLSAYIAQRSGKANVDFHIDMSIDPATVPRVSFIDVHDERFDPAAIKGRNVLIGATAIEMGDRYATPMWGVIPGVIVQALAAETLLRGVPTEGAAVVPLLIVIVASLLCVAQRKASRLFLAFAGSTAALIAAVLVAQHVLLITYPLAPALMMLAVLATACTVREIAGGFRTQRLTDEATGLANRRAFLAAQVINARALVVSEIGNYEGLVGVLGSQQAAEAVRRVGDRLALVADEGRLYRTSERQIAFFVGSDVVIEDAMDGLRAMMLQPVEVAGRRIDVALSMGVARCTGATNERLLVDATLAAEEALRGGTSWRMSVDDDGELERSVTLMSELDDALAAAQIEVFYQPKYHLRDERIVGAEALVRWRHPDRGMIGPDHFIPLAEKTNRIAPLTLAIIRDVVRDLSALRENRPELTVAINISAKLLSDGGFNRNVEAILANSVLPATALVFEVTESAAMSDPKSAIAALRRYRALGIAVSMDDYGTGQSTLTYLRELPLNELKIDRSFVQHAHINHDDGVLVRSTISLAHELGLKVVAEGIEDPGCLTFLHNCNCDTVQGYLISRPLQLAQFKMMLDKESSDQMQRSSAARR